MSVLKSNEIAVGNPQQIVPQDAHQASLLTSWFAAAMGKVADGVVASRQFVVALSGGVDSAVVAKAAALAAAQFEWIDAVLVTGDSPSLARQELSDAVAVAARIELPHVVVETAETRDAAYKVNDARRCYHCKSHLFTVLEARYPAAVIVTGTNADDLQDYRPGLQAAAEHRVRAPLAELGFGKAEVRALASYWGLPIADKPASPCLASRIAYGVEVTSERLEMVERAERWLREHGLSELRVRLHTGELARIEVPLKDLTMITTEPVRGELLADFKSIGFRFVTLDLAGFASGSLNQLIQLER